MSFDFEKHRIAAVTKYAPKLRSYEDFAMQVRDILKKACEEKKIKVHSIEARAKSEESFGHKSAIPLESDPTKPKYENPLEQIHDLAGARVITFLRGQVEEVCQAIEEQFQIVERVDHGASLLQK